MGFLAPKVGFECCNVGSAHALVGFARAMVGFLAIKMGFDLRLAGWRSAWAGYDRAKAGHSDPLREPGVFAVFRNRATAASLAVNEMLGQWPELGRLLISPDFGCKRTQSCLPISYSATAPLAPKPVAQVRFDERPFLTKATDRADRNSSNLSDRDGQSNSKLRPNLFKRDLAVASTQPATFAVFTWAPLQAGPPDRRGRPEAAVNLVKRRTRLIGIDI